MATIILFLLSFLGIIGIYIFSQRSDPFNFRFNSASFTSLDDATDPNLNAKFNTTFIITNPNENYNIYYESIVATLDNGGCDETGYSSKHIPCVPLGSAVLTPFLQHNRSENTIQAQINLVNPFMGNDIAAARAQGSVEFGIQFHAQFNTSQAKTFKDTLFAVFLSKKLQANNMRLYCKLSFGLKSNNATFASETCLSNGGPEFLYDSIPYWGLRFKF